MYMHVYMFVHMHSQQGGNWKKWVSGGG